MLTEDTGGTVCPPLGWVSHSESVWSNSHEIWCCALRRILWSNLESEVKRAVYQIMLLDHIPKTSDAPTPLPLPIFFSCKCLGKIGSTIGPHIPSATSKPTSRDVPETKYLFDSNIFMTPIQRPHTVDTHKVKFDPLIFCLNWALWDWEISEFSCFY